MYRKTSKIFLSENENFKIGRNLGRDKLFEHSDSELNVDRRCFAFELHMKG